ncbi:unnamed protein product, partial [Polarella glacialis]
DLTFLALLLCVSRTGIVVAAPYYSLLKGLRSSSGAWDEPFSPERTTYQVRLSAWEPTVTVYADVDFNRYLSASDYPVVTIYGHRADYGPGKPAVHEVELGGSPLQELLREVDIVVEPPADIGHTAIQ